MTPEEAREYLGEHRTNEFWIDGQIEPCARIRWQTGPHADGRNGLEVDEAIGLILDRMADLQHVLQCPENAAIIYHLSAAKGWVLQRRRARDQQGVRGTLERHRSVPWADPEKAAVPTEGV